MEHLVDGAEVPTADLSQVIKVLRGELVYLLRTGGGSEVTYLLNTGNELTYLLSTGEAGN